MQAIRQTVDAERLCSLRDMFGMARNARVEMNIPPAARQEALPPTADYAALDSLQEYANPALIAGEKNAWQAAATKKAAYIQHAL